MDPIIHFAPVVRQLGIKGKSQHVQLSTWNKSGTWKSEVVDMFVCSETGNTLKLSVVYEVDEIPVMNAAIDISLYKRLL